MAFFNKKSNIKQPMNDARSTYDTNRTKTQEKKEAKRFDKIFKKISKQLKSSCICYNLTMEEVEYITDGCTPCFQKVMDQDKNHALRKALDEQMNYTGVLGQFLTEAREAGFAIKHSWIWSNTHGSWIVDGFIISFRRD